MEEIGEKKIAGSLAVVENLSVSRQICINADTGNKASVYELVGFLAKLHGIRRLHKLVQGIAYRHMEQAAVKGSSVRALLTFTTFYGFLDQRRGMGRSVLLLPDGI